MLGSFKHGITMLYCLNAHTCLIEHVFDCRKGAVALLPHWRAHLCQQRVCDAWLNIRAGHEVIVAVGRSIAATPGGLCILFVAFGRDDDWRWRRAVECVRLDAAASLLGCRRCIWHARALGKILEYTTKEYKQRIAEASLAVQNKYLLTTSTCKALASKG